MDDVHLKYLVDNAKMAVEASTVLVSVQELGFHNGKASRKLAVIYYSSAYIN